MNPAKDTPRLVLYGIGQYGQMIVRLAEKKGWPIVAAYNRAGEKVGQDIGRLAGLDKDYGVIIQDCDKADYSGLEADIGLVTMYDLLSVNFPAYERLLNAGLNVMCHGAESYYAWNGNPKVAKQIDQIAKSNNVTWMGSGVWDMSRIWSVMLAAGVCDEIISIHNTSVTNLEPFGEQIALWAGVGMSPAEFEVNVNDPEKNPYGRAFYKQIAPFALTALGYEVTDYSFRQVPVILDEPFYCELLKRELPKGSCAGLRTIAEATSKEGVTATAHADSRLLIDEGETEHTMWEITGNQISPSIRIERDNGHTMQALSLFNRIKDVIAAPSGLQLISAMPAPMKHTAIL